MLKKVNSLFWVLKKVLFKVTFIKKCSKKVSKKLLSQKSTQKRAFTSEFSQKRASKSESLKKVNYFFKLTFCLYKWATPCISQTYNRRCDIIFGLVRLPGRSRRAPAGPLGGPSRQLGGLSGPLGGLCGAVRRGVRSSGDTRTACDNRCRQIVGLCKFGSV